MVYIHEKTLDGFHDVGCDESRGYFFECDELIAPTIQLLNYKGYKTKFCCSGHAYNDTERYYVCDGNSTNIQNDKTAMSMIMSNRNLDIWRRTNDDEDVLYTVIKSPDNQVEPYVCFERELDWYNLPLLPDGWTIFEDINGSKTNIRYIKPFTGVDEFERLEEIFYIMKELYEWAKSLEDINND